MKNPAFFVGALLFCLTLLVDGVIIYSGLFALGVLSAIGTILVFAAVLVWLIYRDDRRLHFRRLWLIVPLTVFGFSIFNVFMRIAVKPLPAPENLQETGNLLMSRYQIGLWLVSVVLLLIFVAAGSLMKKGRA